MPRKRKMRYFDEGAECRVYDLGNGRLYKQYSPFMTKRELNTIIRKAKKAAKHGIGPTVYYTRKGGYVTRKVDRAENVSTNEVKKLIKKAKEIFPNFYSHDIMCFGLVSTRNLGRINGKLVLIDFGPLST